MLLVRGRDDVERDAELLEDRAPLRARRREQERRDRRRAHALRAFQICSIGQRRAQAVSSPSRYVESRPRAAGPRLRSSTSRPCSREEADPLADREVELDRALRRLDPVHAEVRLDAAARSYASASSSQASQTSGVAPLNANRPPGRSSRAASGTVRYGSAKVIAPQSHMTTSNDASCERHRLRARVQEREVDARLRVGSPGVLEPGGRVVEPDGPRAGARGARATTRRRRSRARATSRPATSPRTFSSRLGNLPEAPARSPAAMKRGVPLVVRVALPVPELAVPPRVRRQSVRRAHRRRTRARSRAAPTRASRSRGRGCSASRCAKSPRIVPGAASAGFVAPIVVRIVAIAPSPSTTSAQVGAEVMKSTSSPKNGFSRVLGVVLLAELLGDAEQLAADDGEAAALDAGEDLAGERALGRVGLDQDQGALHGHGRGVTRRRRRACGVGADAAARSRCRRACRRSRAGSASRPASRSAGRSARAPRAARCT